MKNGKSAYLDTDANLTISSTGLSFNGFADKLFSAITCSITSANCNETDCYYISFGTESMYIDKETGLTTRILSNIENCSTVTDYVYEFDTVTEEIFEEPDISEYTIVK